MHDTHTEMTPTERLVFDALPEIIALGCETQTVAEPKGYVGPDDLPGLQYRRDFTTVAGKGRSLTAALHRFIAAAVYTRAPDSLPAVLFWRTRPEVEAYPDSGRMHYRVRARFAYIYPHEIKEAPTAVGVPMHAHDETPYSHPGM